MTAKTINVLFRTTVLFTALFRATRAQINHDDRQFVAMDCFQKQDMSTGVPMDAARCGDPAPALTQTAQSYTLLQRATFQRGVAKRCSIVKTQLSLYCGDHDHQTLVPQWTDIQIPVDVSPAECHNYWDTQEYVDPKGGVHRLDTGAVTHIKYESIGQTWTDTHTDIQCVGGKLAIDGQEKYNMIVSVHLTVYLTEEPFLVSEEDEITVSSSQKILNCKFTTQQCRGTSMGTLIWNRFSPKEGCRFFRTRDTTGIESTNKDSSRVYISQDGSMIRLEIRERIFACGVAVYKTNYENLFVTGDKQSTEIFNRPLPETEMSVTVYANQQDSFLYGELTSYIQVEFKSVLLQSCLREKRKDGSAFAGLAAEQRAALDGETTALDNGYFATAAGEAWYKYQCRPITVFANSEKDCYSALPVTLDSVDHERIAAMLEDEHDLVKAGRDKEGEPKTTQYFMEPHTRRLTRIGTRMPCVKEFAPLYRNTKGAWIEVTPELKMAREPKPMQDDTGKFSLSKPRTYDFEAGGIYDKAAVKRMDRLSQTPRAMRDIATILAGQTGHFAGKRLKPHDLFSEIPDISFGWLSGFWSFLEVWGTTLSIVALIFTIVKIITFSSGLIARVYTSTRLFGWSKEILCICLPSCLDVLLITSGLKHADVPQRGAISTGLAGRQPAQAPSNARDAEQLVQRDDEAGGDTGFKELVLPSHHTTTQQPRQVGNDYHIQMPYYPPGYEVHPAIPTPMVAMPRGGQVMYRSSSSRTLNANRRSEVGPHHLGQLAQARTPCTERRRVIRGSDIERVGAHSGPGVGDPDGIGVGTLNRVGVGRRVGATALSEVVVRRNREGTIQPPEAESSLENSSG